MKGSVREKLLVFLVPWLIVVALIFFSRPSTRRPHSTDPTEVNPQYASLVAAWSQAAYTPIQEIGEPQVRGIRGFAEMNLSEVEEARLTEAVLHLFRSHSRGDLYSLRRLMLPDGRDQHLTWALPGQRRVSLVFKSGGLAGEKVERLMSTSVWESIELAWTTMVNQHGLTNWWSSAALDESEFWIHRVKSDRDLPDVFSETYGPFAGTASGPAFVEYGARFNDPPVQTYAALRILIGMHEQEKPIVFVFRWRWSNERQFWFPFDKCMGTVGKRLPDPFF